MSYYYGKDVNEISHLSWWHEKEVDELTINLLASFENFIHYCFVQRFGKPPTRVQMDIARWMAHGDDKRGVMAFRNAAKTTIASCYCVWWAWREPRFNIVVVSGTQKLATGITTECKVWLNLIDILEDLQPTAGQRTSAMMFDVRGAVGGKDATFRAFSIGSAMASIRAHIVLSDDIEQPTNCDSAPKRETLYESTKEFRNILHDSKSTDYVSGFNPMVMYLGTPHNEESVYSKKIMEGYTFRIWPGRYPNDKYMTSIGHMVSPMLLEDMMLDDDLKSGWGPKLDEGRVTDEERFTEDFMLEQRIGNGEAGFAKQYMLDTSLQSVNKYPLKLEDLIVADLDPVQGRGRYMSEREAPFILSALPCVGLPGDRYYRPSFMSDEVYKYDFIVMAIDPSGRGADETAYAIVAVLNGNFFVLDAGGMAGYDNGYSDTVLTTLATKAKQYKVNKVIVESNMGDGIFTRLITPYFQKIYKDCTIAESRAVGQKELRIIDTLEPVMSQRKLIVNRKVIVDDYENTPLSAKDSEQPTYRMFYQMARITRNRNSLSHDDRLDALEAAVRELIDSLALDQQTQEEDKRETSLYNSITNGMSVVGGVLEYNDDPSIATFF
jgi:hypothetical protein